MKNINKDAIHPNTLGIIKRENKQDNLLRNSVGPLLQWYYKGHRELPWRKNKDPYRIWVSEIMLQQTRVEAVKPYYLRFMENFPTVIDLANAEDEKLLKLWEGLGYYSRVKNMKKAAVIVKEEYGGEMPKTSSELCKLPGIGSYTSGAIASIAYGEAVPAVDGNVLRVLSRLRQDERNVSLQVTKKEIEEEILQQMPLEAAGDYNQALMELGATVCLPVGNPKCEICPWNQICLAHKNEKEMNFPVKNRKKKRTVEYYTVLILKDGKHLALRKRPADGLLAGLYEFPMYEGRLEKKEVLEKLKEIGLAAIRIKVLELSKHVFTHKEWHMIGYAVYVDELSMISNTYSDDIIFISPEDIKEKFPVPSAFKAYAKYVDMKLGKDVFCSE